MSLNQKVEDHKEIVRLIQEKVASGDIIVNTGVIECIMRAMLEALADDETWVAPTVSLTVNTALLPFMRFYDKQNFIDQHTLYC